MAAAGGRHVPGTSYRWKHGWQPLTVATAIKYRKGSLTVEGLRKERNQRWSLAGRSGAKTAKTKRAYSGPLASHGKQPGTSRRSLSSLKATPTPFKRSSDAGSVDDRIRATYDRLAPHPRAWVKHTDVRRQLPGVPAADLDAAFHRLSRADDVEMMGEANQKTLSAEDHRHAVRVGGQNTHLIAMGF